MININKRQRIPKYKQIVKSIKNNIKNGTFNQGDKIPSINGLQKKLSVARNTVIKAYDELIAKGIITSISGKGYYISKASHEIDHNIFLLFDLFLPYKENIYTAFKDNIGENAIVDIYFHHYDKELYKKLIRGAIGQYTDYVIMPVDSDKNLINWFDKIFHNQNVYILDLGLEQYGHKYPSVCQNFKKQWYNCLSEAEDHIKKYNRLVLKHRAAWSKSEQPHDREMLAGFNKFCQEKQIQSKIIDKKVEMDIKKNDCYFITDDNDLVTTIKKARDKNLTLGEDIGVISHNDTPLKSICCWNGVATITTDFSAMGKNMAEMINNGEKKHLENTYHLILRNSI